MARVHGDVALAQRWDGCADTISRGMAQELTERDARYGVTWKPVSWGWSYGHESLAPAFMSADSSGYTLATSGTLTITLQTYRRQVELPSGFDSGRTIGYGQAFLTQAALMLDDMAGAAVALDNLANFIYDADAEPYLVPEGVALHPSGDYWYRTGDLGNAMHEAEVLKTLALVAGVDDLAGQRLSLVPRLPSQWTSMSVADYPVTVAGQRLNIGYTLLRDANRLRMDITATRPIPKLDVRLGPLPAGVTPQVTVDGVARAALIENSGGNRWVWMRNLDGWQKVQIEVRW
jgi:hypothetical protein